MYPRRLARKGSYRTPRSAYPALSLSPAVNSISHGIRGVQQKAIKESGGEL